jgi:hypothetical protein
LFKEKFRFENQPFIHHEISGQMKTHSNSLPQMDAFGHAGTPNIYLYVRVSYRPQPQDIREE